LSECRVFGSRKRVAVEMTDHVSTSQMELFAGSALPEAETDSISEHLMTCESCHQLFVEALRSQKDSTGLSFTVSPESLLRHEHIQYEQLVGLAENRLDATDREIIDTHLKACATCREDFRSFLAFKNQLEPELRVRYGPTAAPPPRKKAFWADWWRGLAWNPAYAAAVVLIGIALVVGAVLLLKRRAGSLEAKKTQPSQGVIGSASQAPTPDNQAVSVQPTPVPLPSEQLPRYSPSPALTVKNQEGRKPLENAGVVATLNDERGRVTIDRAGNVSGLDEIPQNTRRQIADALLAENIKAPATQTELGGGPVSLRGPGKSPTFKLLSPARVVIISDRPFFEWEKLGGATSYQVSVGDLKGHEIAKSEALPADQIRWTPSTSLKRGEIYVWEVEATIDSKKIVSPGRSAPQMKFKVLSSSSAQELEQLKTARSHLALGVFYAREGMVAEAEHEFQILVRDNPRTTALKKLLTQIQSWRDH
jgi:predicted anti-sigma-YlaC factor YlaD